MPREAQLSSDPPDRQGPRAAVIGLTITDAGIPKTPEERLAAAGKIIERAAKLGIPPEDVIIDPLVMTVGSDSKAALITLQTIELIRKELRREHQPGCEQCLVWAAGPHSDQSGLPRHGHPGGRNLLDH